MSNTEKAMKWTKKFKPKHLTVGTQVKHRDGVVSTIVGMVGIKPFTRVGIQGRVKFHSQDGTHRFGESQYDIVSVLKAVKDKHLDLRKAVRGSRITFSNGQKAVVDVVEVDGSDSTFISHDNPNVKDGWYFNISGGRCADEGAPRIIKLKPPKKDSE